MVKLIAAGIVACVILGATAATVTTVPQGSLFETNESENTGPRAGVSGAVGGSGTPPPSPPPTVVQNRELVALDLLVVQKYPPETRALLDVTVKVVLDAELTNFGTADGNNVRVEARARVGDDYVAIDGQDQFVTEVGTVPAGQTIVQEITFEIGMSLFQGRRAQQDGILFEITLVSDETQQSMPPLRCTQDACEPLGP